MEWWKKTPSIISEHYENIFGITDEITLSEARFIIDETAIPPQSHVLDLCCGTGRHAIRLAELGHHVTGLDISPAFLRIAKEKAIPSDLTIEWVEGDMRNIPFTNTFDLVFIMFGAWGYFDEDRENYIVLEKIHQSLKLGGHFILDFMNYDWIVRNFQPFHWVEREIGYYLEKRYLDIQNGRLNTESVLVKRDGSTLQWETSTRAYSIKEIKNMLHEAGFTLINAFGNLEKQPAGLESPRLLIHAQKNNT